MSIKIDSRAWVEKHERRMRAFGMESPNANVLRLSQRETIGLHGQISRLRKRVERLQSTRPREAVAKLGAAHMLALAVDGYLESRGRMADALDKRLEDALRVYRRAIR